MHIKSCIHKQLYQILYIFVYILKPLVHIDTSNSNPPQGSFQLSLFPYLYFLSLTVRKLAFILYNAFTYLLQNTYKIVSKLLIHTPLKKNKLLTREHYFMCSIYTVNDCFPKLLRLTLSFSIPFTMIMLFRCNCQFQLLLFVAYVGFPCILDGFLSQRNINMVLKYSTIQKAFREELLPLYLFYSISILSPTTYTFFPPTHSI